MCKIYCHSILSHRLSETHSIHSICRRLKSYWKQTRLVSLSVINLPLQIFVPINWSCGFNLEFWMAFHPRAWTLTPCFAPCMTRLRRFLKLRHGGQNMERSTKRSTMFLKTRLAKKTKRIRQEEFASNPHLAMADIRITTVSI